VDLPIPLACRKEDKMVAVQLEALVHLRRTRLAAAQQAGVALTVAVVEGLAMDMLALSWQEGAQVDM